MSVYSDYMVAVFELFDFLNANTKREFFNSPYSKTDLLGERVFNNGHRAVYRCPLEHLPQVEALLGRCESLYVAVAKMYDVRKRPIYLPRVVDTNGLVSIEIHENLAHFSKNYRDDVEFCVASGDFTDRSTRKLLDDAVAELEKLGLAVKVEEESHLRFLYVVASELCHHFECDSIQHRKPTGKQYRANFYRYGEDGLLYGTKPQTLGVVILPNPNIPVRVSHPRKMRKDEIFTAVQPSEILLPISRGIVNGRFYKRFDDKKKRQK